MTKKAEKTQQQTQKQIEAQSVSNMSESSVSSVSSAFAMLPKPKVFSCSQCGECCSKVMVPIERHLVEYLEQQAWVKNRFNALLGEGGEGKTRQDEIGFQRYDESHDVIPHREDGYCVFLGESNQCLIEEVEGLQYKPVECQRFPFGSALPFDKQTGQTEVPDSQTLDSQSLVYDGSVGCRTLAKGLFDGITRWQPSDPSWYESQESENLPEKVAVTRFKSMDWGRYNQWVSHLNRCVLEEGEAEKAERQCRKDSDNKNDFTGMSSWGVLCEAKRSLDVLLKGGRLESPRVKTRVEGMEPAHWEPCHWDRWLTVLLLRKPYGLMNTWAVLTEGDYLDIKIWGPQPVALKGHHQVAWPKVLDAVVARFLVVILSRRLMLAYGHRLDDMLAMAIGTRALVRWYGRTLAHVQGALTVNEEDVLGAIRLVERYYTGHQPMFPESFRWRPGWGTWARWLLND